MQLFLYLIVLSSEPEPDLHKQMTPPKFVKPLASVDVAEGTPATLEAITEGNPAPQVTWYREGHQIMPSNDFQVIVHVIKNKLCVENVCRTLLTLQFWTINCRHPCRF